MGEGWRGRNRKAGRDIERESEGERKWEGRRDRKQKEEIEEREGAEVRERERERACKMIADNVEMRTQDTLYWYSNVVTWEMARMKKPISNKEHERRIDNQY